YSILDGLISVKQLVKKALEYRLPALALTDHGNMFGALDFYTQAREAGVKPIIGSEVYVAPASRFDKAPNDTGERSHHLILLARDETGYKNLMKLSSAGFLEGFYYKPRIDKELLQSHASGLLAMSSCTKGEIPQAILRKELQKARAAAAFYKELFGEHFFLELQDHGMEEEKKVIPALAALAKELDIPLVATNDVHYLESRDARAHDALLCIQTQSTVADQNRLKFVNDQFCFKSPEEMASLFREFPGAVANTVAVAERCNLILSDLGSGKLNLIPSYQAPKEYPSQMAYLRYLAETGLAKRYPKVTPGHEERLNKELAIIEKMNFAGYFLVVKDFIDFAKQHGVPVGPGRGSAVGSLVLYSLAITDVEPLGFNLLFERFLNPERASMPDIDIDFGDTKRDLVIGYVTEKYGKDSVCQIITFGTMQARAAVRDVARVLGIAYGEADKIAKLIPFGSAIGEAMKGVPDLARLIGSDPRFVDAIEIAKALEGRIRNAGTHAAGVVITPGKLTDYLPLYKNTKGGEISTQYEMGWLEQCGLLKMDFLGLRNLTVIEDTLAMVRAAGRQADIHAIPYDDPATYELLRRGDTTGLFQLESSGMRELTVKFQTSTLDDIIAIISLYRPGPMDLIPEFLERKNGRRTIEYEHPLLEPICRDTYGVMIYQEQVMQAVQALAGYTLGAGYLLLKAISKKKPEVLEKQRPAFVKGCKAINNIPQATAEKIFDTLAKFAGYGFNKSHAAGYAVLAYQTAYLKAHFPKEYMAALLSSVMGDSDKTILFMANCREMGIRLLPPDINASSYKYAPEGDSVRIGLGAVKNTGQSALEAVIAARQVRGRFDSLEHLLESVDGRFINRKSAESLIKAGCFDTLDPDRSGLLLGLDQALDGASQAREMKLKGQTSIFDLGPVPSPPCLHAIVRFGTQAWRVAGTTPPPAKRVDPKTFLTFEKEALGFYLSGHPLEKYSLELKSFATHTIGQLAELRDESQVILGGVIGAVKLIAQKNGGQMAFVTIEDLTGSCEIIVFSDLLETKRALIAGDSMVLVAGTVSTREEEAAKVVAADLFPLERCQSGLVQHLEIHLEQNQLSQEFNQNLSNLLDHHPGECPVVLLLKNENRQAIRIKARKHKVKPGHALFTELAALLGAPSYWFCGKWEPAPPKRKSKYGGNGKQK
ncbi:MAG: DNA polymerase III subunit alpha, partial [Candidatus Edwardsbacteria bacterium]|nr:DNA polymerase III subunit alpha [Candidatus Edwardsbacteria bacterium]